MMCYSQSVIATDYGHSRSQHAAQFPREQIWFQNHCYEINTRVSGKRALVRFGLTAESDSCT